MSRIARRTAGGHRLKPKGLAACVTLVLAGTVGAAHAATPLAVATADSRQLSFAGTAFASSPNENVDIAGTLHVVTRLSGSADAGWTLDWNAHLNNATGYAQATGTSYRAQGADGGSLLFPPGPPTRTAFLTPSFLLMPPGPPVHPPSPIRVAVTVALDENGRIGSVVIRIPSERGQIGTVD